MKYPFRYFFFLCFECHANTELSTCFLHIGLYILPSIKWVTETTALVPLSNLKTQTTSQKVSPGLSWSMKKTFFDTPGKRGQKRTVDLFFRIRLQKVTA